MSLNTRGCNCCGENCFTRPGKNGGTLIPGNGKRGPGRATLAAQRFLMMMGRDQHEAYEYLIYLKCNEPRVYIRVALQLGGRWVKEAMTLTLCNALYEMEGAAREAR